jgi:regulatory protein
VRWRSREELRRRLLRAGFDAADVASTLEGLEASGLVEDGRFAREVVRHQAGSRLAGDRAIRETLRAKGVAAEVVERAVAEAGDEAQRALDLARRRAPKLASLGPEQAHRRLFGLLIRRGYPVEVARDACREALRSAMEPGDDAPPID